MFFLPTRYYSEEGTLQPETVRVGRRADVDAGVVDADRVDGQFAEESPLRLRLGLSSLDDREVFVLHDYRVILVVFLF